MYELCTYGYLIGMIYMSKIFYNNYYRGEHTTSTVYHE